MYRNIFKDLQRQLEEEGTLKVKRNTPSLSPQGKNKEYYLALYRGDQDTTNGRISLELLNKAEDLRNNPGIQSARDAIEVIQALKEQQANEVGKLFIQELKVEY